MNYPFIKRLIPKLALFSLYTSLTPYQCNPFIKDAIINEKIINDNKEAPFIKDSNPLDLRSFIKEKGFQRIFPLEEQNRSHQGFFYNGLIKSLSIFSIYEVYGSERTYNRFIQKELSLPHEKEELGLIYVLFKANSITQGHKEIVHGGLSATLIDHFMGRMSDFVGDGEKVATINLNINYKKPIMVGKEHLLEVRFEKIEKNRKIYLKCRIINENQQTCIDSTGLFIKVKW